MTSYYVLRIYSPRDISSLFPLKLKQKGSNLWEYEIVEYEADPPFDFISIFTSMLDRNQKALLEFGINTRDITVLWLYEYIGECSLEILPKQMAALAERGLSLCISCWEKKQQ